MLTLDQVYELLHRPHRDYQVRIRLNGKLLTYVVKGAPSWVHTKLAEYQGPGDKLAQHLKGQLVGQCLLDRQWWGFFHMCVVAWAGHNGPPHAFYVCAKAMDKCVYGYAKRKRAARRVR